MKQWLLGDWVHAYGTCLCIVKRIQFSFLVLPNEAEAFAAVSYVALPGAEETVNFVLG